MMSHRFIGPPITCDILRGVMYIMVSDGDSKERFFSDGTYARVDAVVGISKTPS